MRYIWTAMALSGALLLGCEEEVQPMAPDNDGSDGDSDGDSDSDSDADGDPDQEMDDENCQSLLVAIVRDFSVEHPDFKHTGITESTPDMVREELDEEDKPVRGEGDYYSEHIDEWYRTIDGTNYEFEHTMGLTEDPDNSGHWVYESSEFFPIGPDEGFGADIEAYDKNYLFTTEIVVDFRYEPGQVFTFKGDDDVWVFINRKLVIDLGGIHSELTATQDIDEFAEENGLEVGKNYPMHIFHAERNPTFSRFRIETTIRCFDSPVI